MSAKNTRQQNRNNIKIMIANSKDSEARLSVMIEELGTRYPTIVPLMIAYCESLIIGRKNCLNKLLKEF